MSLNNNGALPQIVNNTSYTRNNSINTTNNNNGNDELSLSASGHSMTVSPTPTGATIFTNYNYNNANVNDSIDKKDNKKENQSHLGSNNNGPRNNGNDNGVSNGCNDNNDDDGDNKIIVKGGKVEDALLRSTKSRVKPSLTLTFSDKTLVCRFLTYPTDIKPRTFAHTI
jgi:hypothetical protein